MRTLVYNAAETRNKIGDIQRTVNEGLINKTVNKATKESMFMINTKLINGLLKKINIQNIIEYDEKLKIYTCYNEIVPHFVGEGDTEKEASENMLREAIDFSIEYGENIELYSAIFDGLQQFIIGYILLNIKNENEIRKMLKIA